MILCALPTPALAQTQVAAACFWNNGAPDNRTAQLSQSNIFTGDARTADDFYLCPGTINRIDSIRATMYTSAVIPKARLEIYEDCDGLPAGNPIVSVLSATATDLGQPYSGYKTVEFVFNPADLWLPGGTSGKAYWLSISGVGNLATPDEYYWATADNLNVKGLSGVYRANISGPVNWTSVASLGCACTDFNFNITGTSCKLLLDSIGSGPDPAAPYGISSLSSNVSMQSRAADDFAVPGGGCDNATLCFLQAIIYTNCNPVRGNFELYNSDCSLPSAPPPSAPAIPTPLFTTPFAKVIDLNTTITVGGDVLKAYAVQAVNLNFSLPRGRNYWLSPAIQGSGALRQKGLVALAAPNCKTNCKVTLNPAAATGNLLGLAAWTTSAQLIGADRDLAIQVGIAEPAATATNATPTCATDVNHDGFSTIDDIFIFINTWLSGCP